jgi:hypothetical protein
MWSCSNEKNSNDKHMKDIETFFGETLGRSERLKAKKLYDATQLRTNP